MGVQGAGGGLGPVGIPLHFHPHPGQDFEAWHTQKIEKKGEDFVLHGLVGVGVLEPGTVTIDAKGHASVKSVTYGGHPHALDTAELDVFKQRLAADEQAGGPHAALIQAALDRLGGGAPPGPPSSVLDAARFGDVKRDVKGGLAAHFGFGVDQGGTIYATKGGKLSWETHIVPMKPGKPHPMSKADREALAAKIRPLALTSTPPNPLWVELLNDALK